MFRTPILYLIFNRPDLIKISFQSIRAIRPKFLFIAADGPRTDKPEDINKCKLARDYVLNHIDWKCNVKTLFRNKNLGCKIAISSAINWFFDNVEEGIILEDDCLPDRSFYNFCEQMLSLYRYNTKIMHISGSNYQFGKKRGTYDYYYSRIANIWGWASWRRVWKEYDVSIKSFSMYLDKKKEFQLFPFFYS